MTLETSTHIATHTHTYPHIPTHTHTHTQYLAKCITWLSIHYTTIHLFIYLSVCFFVFTFLSFHLSICVSACLSVTPALCLFIHPRLSPILPVLAFCPLRLIFCSVSIVLPGLQSCVSRQQIHLADLRCRASGYPAYAQRMPSVCPAYAQRVPSVCPASAQRIPSVCPAYAQCGML